MDLLRRKALRAASLILILAALAAPAYAIDEPIINWTPNGTDSGDPDMGGGNINYLRHFHHVLVFSVRRLLNPATAVVVPTTSYRTDWPQQTLKRK